MVLYRLHVISTGNATNTVVFLLTVIALAVAVCIGDGCCAHVSSRLGSGKLDEARRSFGNAIVLAAGSGVVLCAVYLLLQDPLITMFGGTVNQETFHQSQEYFFWITTGIPFYMFGQAMNPVIRADGSPRFAMASTLAGALVNILLDPLFIFVFRWGMMGAAVATVLGQILTAGLAVWYLCHLKSVQLERSSFRLQGSTVRRTLSLGICSFLSQISLVAAMAAINNMIRTTGALDPVFGQEQYAQIPMAVVGIVMKFFQIVISIVVGMAAGCIPIVGFNMGAGRNYTDFALKAFRIYLCMMVLACVNKAAFIFLQAMGKAVASTALSMIREILFGVGFALLLPQFFGLDGVLWSMPVSDVLTVILSGIIIWRTYRELRSNMSFTQMERHPFNN